MDKFLNEKEIIDYLYYQSFDFINNYLCNGENDI